VNEKGFVLPMTLIVLALLTVLSMGLSQMARSSLSDVQARSDMFDAEVQLKGASQWALYQLLTGQPDKSFMRNGSAILPLNNTPVARNGVEIRVQDAAGLISLGYYDEALFKRLMELYVPGQEAALIAARLGDWIDSDQRARPNGLEAVDYIKAGLPMLPRNGPIRTLDELLEIPGLTAGIFNGDGNHQGLRDLVLAGGASYFNLASAPAEVIGPVLGLNAKEVKRLLVLRQNGDWRLLRESVVSHDPYGRSSNFLPAQEFRIKLKTKSGYTARGLFLLRPAKPIPYDLILWQYPDFNRG